jgi:hypothetical protein
MRIGAATPRKSSGYQQQGIRLLFFLWIFIIQVLSLNLYHIELFLSYF